MPDQLPSIEEIEAKSSVSTGPPPADVPYVIAAEALKTLYAGELPLLRRQLQQSRRRANSRRQARPISQRPSRRPRASATRSSAKSGDSGSSSSDDSDPGGGDPPGAKVCRSPKCSTRHDRRSPYCSEKCKKWHARNPNGTSSSRDTSYDDYRVDPDHLLLNRREVQGLIEAKLAERARGWQQKSPTAAGAAVHGTSEPTGLEAELRGLWRAVRLLRAGEGGRSTRAMREIGAPAEPKSVPFSGRGPHVGSSSLFETPQKREARLGREAKRAADELEEWRRRRGFIRPSATVIELRMPASAMRAAA